MVISAQVCDLKLVCSSFPDLDECSLDPSPCDVNADCANNIGSYICTCKQGYAGNGTVCAGMS